MADPHTVYVNEQPTLVPAGCSVIHAVKVHDAQLAEQIESGGGYLTDGVGTEIAATQTVSPGDIIRAVVGARKKPTN